jgi:hypothetical protein
MRRIQLWHYTKHPTWRACTQEPATPALVEEELRQTLFDAQFHTMVNAPGALARILGTKKFVVGL